MRQSYATCMVYLRVDVVEFLPAPWNIFCVCVSEYIPCHPTGKPQMD